MSVEKIAISLVPSPQHTYAGHPESPDRFAHFHRILDEPLKYFVREIIPEPASIETIQLVHPHSYILEVAEASNSGPGFIDYGDTYVTPASYDGALEAVGGTWAVLDAVIRGKVEYGFALVRPPGHHATATQAMGFCLFNNIAIATRKLQIEGFHKVMIVDFDVHHGNGTQAIFESDETVLYVSTHQWGIYPGTGSLNEKGLDNGEGAIINIPLPAHSGDRAFAAILERIISPAAYRFKPEAILISAGFDAHWRDPLASLQLTTRGFYNLGCGLRKLADELCESRLVFVLEGGYDPGALAENVQAILLALIEEDLTDELLGSAPHQETDANPIIDEVIRIHSL